MSNASITIGMPIRKPGLADAAGHEALISDLIRQATSMIAGVILLRTKSSFASPGTPPARDSPSRARVHHSYAISSQFHGP